MTGERQKKHFLTFSVLAMQHGPMFEGSFLGAPLAEAFHVATFSCRSELQDAKGCLLPSAIIRAVPTHSNLSLATRMRPTTSWFQQAGARCAVQESKEAMNTPLALLRCCSSLVPVLHRRRLPRPPQTRSSVALYRKSQPQLDVLRRGAATTHKDRQRRRTVRRKEEEKKE